MVSGSSKPLHTDQLTRIVPAQSPPPALELFEYHERRPSGLLASFVESIWFARGHHGSATDLIAPTGSTVAAVVLGDPIRQWLFDAPDKIFRAVDGYLIGAHDRPVVSRPEGLTFCVGVSATPVGCLTAFGVAPEPIKRRVLGLDGTTLGTAEFRAELGQLTEPEAVLDRLEALLTLGLAAPDASVRRCQFVIDELTLDPTQSVDSLAYQLSMSHADLDLEFKTVVGLGPRALARVIRVRALLDEVDKRGIQLWTQFATDAGWFDQPALIRDFRRHTGVTPRDYVRSRLGS